MTHGSATRLIAEIGTLPPRLRHELDAIRRAGGCSRVELHQALGLRPATVTHDTARLLRLGLIQSGRASGRAQGRPRLPLEIDARSWQALGVSIEPGIVRVQAVDLNGQPLAPVLQRRAHGAQGLLGETRHLLQQMLGDQILAIGLAVPGFVEPRSLHVLFSAAWPQAGPIDLAPLQDLAAPRRIILDN